MKICLFHNKNSILRGFRLTTIYHVNRLDSFHTGTNLCPPENPPFLGIRAEGGHVHALSKPGFGRFGLSEAVFACRRRISPIIAHRSSFQPMAGSPTGGEDRCRLTAISLSKIEHRIFDFSDRPIIHCKAGHYS